MIGRPTNVHGPRGAGGSLRMPPEVDAVIGGEQQDADGGFDNVEYVPGSPVRFVPTGEPYR